MCVVSMVGDSWRKPIIPSNPWEIKPEDKYPEVWPEINRDLPKVQPDEEVTIEELLSLEEVIEKAKKYDEEHDEEDCVDDSKYEKIDKLIEETLEKIREHKGSPETMLGYSEVLAKLVEIKSLL